MENRTETSKPEKFGERYGTMENLHGNLENQKEVDPEISFDNLGELDAPWRTSGNVAEL